MFRLIIQNMLEQKYFVDIKHVTVTADSPDLSDSVTELAYSMLKSFKDTKSRAKCECFKLILHIYVPIRLHHVPRENNEHLITSNSRSNRKLLKFNYK